MDDSYDITYNDVICADSEKEAIKIFIEIIEKNPEYIKMFGTIKVRDRND